MKPGDLIRCNDRDPTVRRHEVGLIVECLPNFVSGVTAWVVLFNNGMQIYHEFYLEVINKTSSE